MTLAEGLRAIIEGSLWGLIYSCLLVFLVEAAEEIRDFFDDWDDW